MGKFAHNDPPSECSSSSEGTSNSVQTLTRDFFRLATCCAIERFPFIQKWKNKQENTEIKHLLESSKNGEAFLKSSLFEHMPTTIKFYGQATSVKKPPDDQKSSLIWALNPLLPIPIRQILRQSHFSIQPMEMEEDWLGYWGKHWNNEKYKTVLMNQKVNHYPGSFHLGRKDKIWGHIKQYIRRFGPEFDLMPRTFIMLEDLQDLADYLEDDDHAVIIKPPASARGSGISIISDSDDIPDLDLTQSKFRFWIAQKYITNPLLIDGKKFDLRIYAYVPSLDPLTIYFYSDGLVRFAALPYDNDSLSNLNVHLTNYSINRFAHRDGISQDDVDKWSLQEFWEFLAENDYDPEIFKKRITEIVVKTIVCCESHIREFMERNDTDMALCHELFGFDILVDDQMDFHLLEVNISPSLQAHTQIDRKVKCPLIQDILTMCRFAFPVPAKELDDSLGHSTRHCCGNFTEACRQKMCRVIEEYKQSLEIPFDIIEESQLTGADIRCLCNFEDEYNGRGNLELVYPFKDRDLQEKYFQFIRNPTYFDMLLNNWCIYRFENQESEKEALNLLRKLCLMGNHISTNDMRLPKKFRAPYADIDQGIVSGTPRSETSISS
uniref:Uncharacterized protein n=1 Tax=Panagrolaimus sp. JU765 TaxID=591449 RepID=A0AC34RJ43_9BILA